MVWFWEKCPAGTHGPRVSEASSRKAPRFLARLFCRVRPILGALIQADGPSAFFVL